MEPRIQYAKTKDGVSIAYYTIGQGAPFVYTPVGPLGSIQQEATVLAYRSLLDELAKGRMLIRYDTRGGGLSGGGSDYSLEAWTSDLVAVVDRLNLDRFDLLGSSFISPVAIAFAAANPDHVSRLILWSAAARGSDFLGSPRDRALATLMETDWELWTETMAHLSYGWSAGEPARRFAERVREGSTPAEVRKLFRAVSRLDVTELLSEVRCPTLILHRRESPLVSTDVARELAANIPDARLTVIEGGSAAMYLGDTDPVINAINEFLGEPAGAEVASAESETEAFRTILFTDVVGSTALTQRLGDAAARDVLREHERIVREALNSHGGSEVKTMGDGFMASFSSATRALECSIAMQRAFAERNESAEEPVNVRVGLNAGEPIAEEQDLFGTAVIGAARIAALADGSEILVSNVVRELMAGKPFLFADRGETLLKGFEDPMRLFEVSWRG